MYRSGTIRRSRWRGLGDPSGWQQYSEQVLQRHGNGRYTIALKPLGEILRLGAISAGNSIGPWTLLGPAVVSPSGGTLSSAASSAAAGASAGAMFGPIGAGIGAIAGAIAGIWASHAARAKGAKTENAAVNSAVEAFDSSIKAIFQAANSGQITGAQAASLCSTVLQSYWQGMAPYMVGPGRSDCSNQGSMCSCSDPYCKNSKCTAGCCVGCFDIMPSIASCVAALSSPTGGTANIAQVYGSGYGASARAGYSLTYTVPGVGTAGGAVDSLTSTSVAGIPLWLLLVGGGLGIYAATR
jgi:hypothetical protein